jgi:DNA-binding NtrC family response regulator
MTDLVMPGMDGLEFLERIRDMGYDRATIVYTGYSGEEVADRCYACGADWVLQKPLGFRMLREMVDLVLAGFRPPRNSEELERLLAAVSKSRPKVRQLLECVHAAADSGPNGLIIGEDSDAEAAAVLAHAIVGRGQGAFTTIRPNSAGPPLDRVLFGISSGGRHEPGALAFDRHGTLFIDNLEEVKPAVQRKLACWLRDSAARAPESLANGVRLICSVKQSPEDCDRSVRDGLRREGFAWSITVPRLDWEDKHLLSMFCRDCRRNIWRE